MATNLHAAVRYHVIDTCLRESHRKWEWGDLAERCMQYFNSHGMSAKKPSKRSIMYDISNMRSGRLGYEAPILYNYDQGYFYSDPEFSISQNPLNKKEKAELNRAFQLVKQLAINHKMNGISTSIDTLSRKLGLDTKNTEPIIYFEESLNEPGQKWIDLIFEYIKEKRTCMIDYLPFDKPRVQYIVSPCILKEYNNRWYVVGFAHDLKMIINLSLDRIKSINKSISTYQISEKFHPKYYYKNVYGITVPENLKIHLIKLQVKNSLLPYLITKPIHPTQTIRKEMKVNSLVDLELVINYEIVSKILSFGSDIKVISPKGLVDQIRMVAHNMIKLYQY